MLSRATQACVTHAGQCSTTATQGAFGALFVMHRAARSIGCEAVRGVSKLCTSRPSQPYNVHPVMA